MNGRLIALGEIIHDALLEYRHKTRTSAFTSNLMGACAIASGLFVVEAKRKHNLDIEFMVSHNHAWTEYRGAIYDITATQFGNFDKVFYCPKKAVANLTDWHRNNYRVSNSDIIYRDINDVNHGWPEDQRPANYRLKWINQYKARVIFDLE
jgi:hypothetical protein